MREPYKIKYGKELVASLDKKLGGDVEKLVDALMASPLEYDLKQLKKAMKGAGTDEAVLIEILCSRTPQQMEAIRIEYEKEFQKSLDEDVASDTSGEFREVLRALVNGSRDDSKETDDHMAHEEAARLYDSGNAKLSSKEAPSHFKHLLCTENQYQLRKIFDAYILLSGTTIEDTIEKEFSGDLKNSYLTIVRAATNKQNYFATQLYNAMKGLGTHDNDLIRAIVSRSEVDLELIKEEYKALYGNTLEEAIRVSWLN
ncbi:unnamed protein product [Heligmosomoides polygyrus]|uniref:Annexin n=1 Tax=Heligmosomoides polygyrus TaxID=6339 RepID=A0A3P8E4E5_HELPZ|nr:unnamed protein product [Heligmosomoides polygyrus]